MPYASNGVISTDPIEGGIPITHVQYAEVLDGMAVGKVVTIDGGFRVDFPDPPEEGPEEPEELTANDVDVERDRRIALGFTWNGKVYQSRPFDLDNIRSMGNAATAMMAQGQVDNSYRWFDPAQDFIWIAADNSLTPMTATDMIDFGMSAARYVRDCIFAASAIKATAGGIPVDYAANSRWPDAPASQ